MKTIWKTGAVIAALWLALPLSAAARSDEPNENGIEAVQGVAAGLGVNVPLVGRLVGGGNTLYISTVDVTNNTATDAQVDFYLDGQDLASGGAISRVGSISSSGTLVAQGGGGLMRHRSNAHFADFIDALVQAGILPASAESDGFIGSVLFVFNGFTKLGQGSATVRFYNSFGGGSIGQSLKGHDIAAGESQVRRRGLPRHPVPVGGAPALRQHVHQQHRTDSRRRRNVRERHGAPPGLRQLDRESDRHGGRPDDRRRTDRQRLGRPAPPGRSGRRGHDPCDRDRDVRQRRDRGRRGRDRSDDEGRLGRRDEPGDF